MFVTQRFHVVTSALSSIEVKFRLCFICSTVIMLALDYIDIT